MTSAYRFMFFVDGSNLLGSLKKMTVQVDDYGAFFQYIFDQAFEIWKASFKNESSINSQLIRVNWYEIGSIDDWDLSKQDTINTLHDAFNKDPVIKRSYMASTGQANKDLSQDQIAKKAWDTCFFEVSSWYEQKKITLNSIKRFHHGVQASTDYIDIFECGHWKVDLLYKKLEEKGLDTSLAVDMVTLLANYDVAILLTGDADAIPSLSHAKRAGKQVCVIEFIKGFPPESKGRQSSSRLKVAADFVIQIYEMDLLKHSLAKRPPQTSTT